MKLEIGSSHFEVRTEQYMAAIPGAFSILYLSDLHFNRFSHRITLKMIERIQELDPDIILLGGDYVDFKKDLVHLNTLLQAISSRKNVFAIAGNHDYSFGINTIRDIMEANKVDWIEKDSRRVTINNTVIQIDGSRPSDRKSEVDFSILCLHHPKDISKFTDNYNVVFAGHLHGCQFVLWEHRKALYPGKLFYKWNVLEKKMDNCNFYISKGMGDTLPVRINCAKEMILVQVNGNKT